MVILEAVVHQRVGMKYETICMAERKMERGIFMSVNEGRLNS